MNRSFVRPSRWRGRGVAIAVLATGAAAAAVLWPTGGRASAPGATTAAPIDPASTTAVQIDPAATIRPIPKKFLGLSIEYWALENYAGQDPGAVNPVLVRLIRNALGPGGGVLRIGGVTTDKTWWPVPGFRRSPGINYSLSARRLRVAGALARATGSRLIMGINLEADSPTLAAAEARAMVRYVGAGRLAEFELGNEPELFGNPNFGWYLRRGHPVTGRPRGYDRATFTGDFARIGRALPRQVPLAGPSSTVSGWIADLGAFVAGVHRLGLVTMHRYPFAACFLAPSAPAYPTINRLLSPVATSGQAASLAPFVTIAHARHLLFSVDEMNSVSCGYPPGVTNSFALALWVVDALFADAAAGVDNVDVHTWPGAVYQLFTFTGPARGWRAVVYPEYYGLLLFRRATPPGSTLVATSSDNAQIRAWATRGEDGRIRLVLINDDTAHPHQVSVGLTHGGISGGGTLELLRAPGAGAKGGVSLAGQRFGTHTRTGVLQGAIKVSHLQPSSGSVSLNLPAATAALIILG